MKMNAEKYRCHRQRQRHMGPAQGERGSSQSDQKIPEGFMSINLR
jgi:hypothetical protein